MALQLEEEGYGVETDLDYEIEYRGESLGSGVITFRVDEEVFVELQGADTDARQQRGHLAGACREDEPSRGLLLNFDRSLFHADVEGDLEASAGAPAIHSLIQS
jgi:hypothetical protein